MANSGLAVCLIVPVLNAESTLAEALDSVVAQTIFDRVHTIIVDNGSTDQSGAIARAYATEHDNIEVVHHIGGGCGGARNVALKLATEPFVAFLDADDILPPTSLQRRLELIEQTGADLVVGAIQSFPEVKLVHPGQAYKRDHVVEGLANSPRLVETPHVASKLFRREFFDAPEHLFLENMHFEDVTVTMAALTDARRIAVLSEVCYRYRRDPDATTIMTNAFIRPENFWDHLKINAVVRARVTDDPAMTVLIDRYLIRSIRRFLAAAPAQLDGGELRAFFDQARDLYRHCHVDQVAEQMSQSIWAVAFYALLADDFELFCDPLGHLSGVEDRDDKTFLSIDRPVIPELGEVLRVRVRAVSATLTAASKAQGGLELSGTLEPIRVEPDHVFPADAGFAVEFGETGLRSPMAMGDRAAPGPVGWTALIDPLDLPAGRHRLRISSAGWDTDKRRQLDLDAPIVLPGIELIPNSTPTGGTFMTVAERPASGSLSS